MREVLTAGPLLTEQFPNEAGGLDTYVWAIVRPECVAALAKNPDAPVELQLAKGHVEEGEATRQTTERESLEELGIRGWAADMPIAICSREAWEYEEGWPIERVAKYIALHLMEQISTEQTVKPDQQAELVRVDTGLLEAMYYPEEAEFLARYFGIEWPVPAAAA